MVPIAMNPQIKAFIPIQKTDPFTFPIILNNLCFIHLNKICNPTPQKTKIVAIIATEFYNSCTNPSINKNARGTRIPNTTTTEPLKVVKRNSI